METKFIQICGKREAENLWNRGMFHSFVKSFLDNYSSKDNKMPSAIVYKRKHTCTLWEAHNVIDILYPSDVLLKYSEDGAIWCGCSIKRPQLMRRIRNVWLPVHDYNDNCSYSDMFSNVCTAPVRELEITKDGTINSKYVKKYFNSKSCDNVPHRVSDNEIWVKKNGIVTVYMAGTLHTDIHCRFKDLFESYLSRKRAEFGEF